MLQGLRAKVTPTSGLKKNLMRFHKTRNQELIKAARFGAIEQTKNLIKAGADVNAKDSEGWTALHLAAKNGHTKIVNLLLVNKAPIDANYDVVTALHIAVENGHTEIVNLLLVNRAKVDAKYDGVTALHIAVMNGRTKIVEALIKAGANVNEKTRDKVTALHWAAEDGNTEIVNLLLANGAKIHANCNGVTALHFAVEDGNTEIVEALVKAGADVNEKTRDEVTVLHWAVSKGHLEIVEALVNAGAELNATNKHGPTALHIAVDYDHRVIVEALVKAKANVNAKDSNGMTALHWATDNGNTEIVKLLLNFGADVNARNNKDYTALHIAVYYDHRVIVEALVKAGAKINATTDFGMTVLQLAKHYHHELSFKNAIEKVKTDVFNELKLLANTSEVIEEAYSVKNKIFTFLQLKNYLIEEYGIQDNEAVTQDQINVMYTLYQFPKMKESFGNCLISLKEWYELENPVICKGNHFEKKDLDRWKNHKSLHPVTNEKNEEIVYFEDIAMKKMIELHKKISITKIQAMARGNKVRKGINL